MLTPNDSSSFENQLSPRQDLTFNSLQALFDQQGLSFTPPSSQFGILQFSNFDLLVSDHALTRSSALFLRGQTRMNSWTGRSLPGPWSLNSSRSTLFWKSTTQ